MHACTDRVTECSVAAAGVHAHASTPAGEVTIKHAGKEKKEEEKEEKKEDKEDKDEKDEDNSKSIEFTLTKTKTVDGKELVVEKEPVKVLVKGKPEVTVKATLDKTSSAATADAEVVEIQVAGGDDKVLTCVRIPLADYAVR